ncbi:hypothetical protein ABPG74_013695 [Tetrahymena malaccensis]
MYSNVKYFSILSDFQNSNLKELENIHLNLSLQNEQVLQDLQQCLMKTKKIQVLQIKLINVENKNQDLNIIASAMVQLQYLKVLILDFSQCYLSDEQVFELGSILSSLQNLNTLKLTLRRNQICQNGVFRLLFALAQSSTISKLFVDLQRNNIIQENNTLIANSIKCYNLTSLEIDLSYCEIQDQHLENLYSNLRCFPNLEKLIIGLDQNKISYQETQRLAHVISEFHDLKSLTLYLLQKKLSIVSLLMHELIKQTIRITRYLIIVQTNFFIRYNQMRAEGVCALGQALIKCKSLKYLLLEISFNEIGDSDISNLGSSLTSIENLTHVKLCLESNKMRCQNMSQIISILVNSPKITSLELFLDNNQIGDEGQQTIGSILKKSENLKTLTFYSVKGCQIFFIQRYLFLYFETLVDIERLEIFNNQSCKMKKQNFENYKLDLANNKKFSSITEFEFIKDPKKNKTQLGVGSFGEVKLAIHKKSGAKFAIKIMNLKNMNSFQEIQGIEREVRVHSLLKHPNIIEYHDSFQENEFVFIVLDYASNGNLYSLLYKKRSFSEKEAYKYFSQTCEAIKYLHSINIVHRDLKPENILLDDEFNIKVCDFGWCTEDIENPRNTFCGTYEYMAPEIVFRQPYDYRIDIWALGVLIYELLHGCAPFKGKTFKEIQRKIEKGDVQFSDQISDLSKQLICKVLQANPSRRISIEDIMSHAWMHKMRAIEKDEKKLNDQSKSTTNLSKPQSIPNNALNTPKVEENDQPKAKEMQQIQKKPDNRSQSPINANQKSSNKNLLNNIESKINEKENISQIPYNSINNAELSDKKKNNTPNKTTAPIPKNLNENMSNQKKLFSNQKQTTAQSIEFHKTIITEPQQEFQFYQKDVQSAQKMFQQSEFNQMDKQTEQFTGQQQQLELKKTRNVKSTTPTHFSSQQSAENMFKNLDQKEVNQVNSIAKRQQEQMKLANNYLTQQVPQQQNEALEQKMNVNTETAYSKEIDENSIKNSQKTINTSRFINKHGSIHGNSLHQPQSSITSSIQIGQNSNYFMPSKGINISQMLQQNNFFNQTDEIKFQLEAQLNSQACTKTEGNQYIQNRNNNPNTSITQEEPCFSLFGCLGPSHISTTQRNRENSSSNQKLQIKNLFSNQNHSHNQSTNSAYSTFANQGENRPRINSTNMMPNNSFLKQQSVNPLNYQSSVSTSQQYGTVIQNQPDKNTFSTQRSSNSLTNKVTNYSFLNQQQNNNNSGFSNNAKISGSYLQQMQQQQYQQSKQPLGDKTNLPVSAIPTKQINLQDERKNIQKQQSGSNCSSSGKQDTQQSQLSSASKNNNSYLQNQYLNKERSLTQDCQTLQNQFTQGQINQNQSFLSNQVKINQQISQNNSNSISYSNSKLDKSNGIALNDVSRSNRTGQRSRTLIFEEINTEKTKSVIESMEQMLSFVRNALPFVSSSSSCQNDANYNQINVNQSSNQNPFANFQDIYNQNDISCNANVSILQNTSISKINSQDSSHTPTNALQNKQSASSKQIININNLKSQRIEQQSSTYDQQLKQNQQKSNNSNTPNCNFNNNINLSQNRNKQKIFESKHSNNSSSFHSNHTPMQSISNLNNVSVNNYFTQKPSPMQSQQNMPSNIQLSKHQSQNQTDYHQPNSKFAQNQNSLNTNNNQACLYFQ